MHKVFKNSRDTGEEVGGLIHHKLPPPHSVKMYSDVWEAALHTLTQESDFSHLVVLELAILLWICCIDQQPRKRENEGLCLESFDGLALVVVFIMSTHSDVAGTIGSSCVFVTGLFHSAMSSRSFHTVACGRISFLLKAE